ncbi:hypothetical protein C2845_PM07G08950 [Panicum miliaceum]|uniref:F-box protein n=1 Tax=Panicum miliaceum TaxID=4540 RepID=A0A3L6SPY5_PANMI|nr:hypothetical protein C2845_PM07G08950 [Panicum miliaceum]
MSLMPPALMAARQPWLSLMADLPTDVAIQIAGHLAATSEWPMDDLRTLQTTCCSMHLMCRNPEVGRCINVAGLTDMAWHTPDAYRTFVACLAQLGNLEASFIHGVNVVFRGPVITPLAVLDENLERAAAGCHEVAAYVAAILLYMANGGAGVDATTRQYMRQAAMAVDNIWTRPAGVRDDMFREHFRIHRSAAHVVWTGGSAGPFVWRRHCREPIFRAQARIAEWL